MNKFLSVFLIAAATTASAVPSSNVVFGNLGNDGLGGLDATNTDITSSVKLGVAFNTGTAAALYLQSISIGAFVGATDNYTLSIYTTSGTAPNLSTGFVTSASLNLANQDSGVFTFSFGGFQLASDTTYWVLPEQGLSWYAPESFENASGLNASGYSFVSNRRSNNSGATWSAYGVPYSISVVATAAPVPEPSTYGLVLGGLALAGAAIARRRKQAK